MTRRLEVLKDGRVVLELTDAPGPLVSTAPPPPNGQVVHHAFLSGAARDAAWEGELKRLLDLSPSLDAYITALAATGFTVREAPGREGR